jgi:glycosyltransferase involved in cell wall biosynthesis
MAEWHLVTSEYPPQPGGVSDYTQLVARGLVAAGDAVHVWAARRDDSENHGAENRATAAKSVQVHREFGKFAPADLRRVGKLLDQFPAPRRLLVQWVPQGFGYRSVNLAFCWWLWGRAKVKHDRVELMVHEPFLPFREGTRKQDLAAAAHRLMITLLLNAASRVWVSIPSWETQLRPFALGKNKPFAWLPVPSNIPVVDDPAGSAEVRARYAVSGRSLVGHFGAYDAYLTKAMLELLPPLVSENVKLAVVLLGNGSTDLRTRLLALHPGLSQSVYATGRLSAAELSRHVSACDLMLQPYQDGVSGRRTSVMTALAHGIPVVTTSGKATESCWHESGAVNLSPVEDRTALPAAIRRLLADPVELRRLARAGHILYEDRFALRHIVAQLRDFVLTASVGQS